MSGWLKEGSMLQEGDDELKRVEPCVMVIFGATGDLTARKLLPALYSLSLEAELPSHFACVGFARRSKDHELFRKEMHQAIEAHGKVSLEESEWEAFSQTLFYHQSRFDDDEGYERLHRFLLELDSHFGTQGNRIYYLSTPPSYFPLIIEKLHRHQLLYPLATGEKRWSRIIVEKPFGDDLPSAYALQQTIGANGLDEEQIWRIDHWLGKETVQNLLVFRFTNSIFEELWNNRHIDHVQICVAEELGIGTRGHFFEEAGNLRDMVQNHMMQLLSLVAMEPPNTMEPASIRNEKVKVMKAIRPFTSEEEVRSKVVRGQYGPGMIGQELVCGYRQEADVSPESCVETYVALELAIDNWRWAGVPFFLRCGKRLPKRATEIAITFRRPPSFLQSARGKRGVANVLVMRIQPDEGIALKFNCKVPGMHEQLSPVKMDFQYGSFFGSRPPEAYEKLLCDCMAGDKTLFASIDEVLASWKLLTPVLELWRSQAPPDFPNYAAGSWGPREADELLLRTGHQWRLF